MFHQAVNGLLHGFMRGSAPQIQTISDGGITLLALFITLGLAMFSYRFFESPFLRLGHRFQYRPKPEPNSTLQATPTSSANIF
jgi:peptidoglycan/LPS O-acetylase OafA/YrhL